MLLDIQVNLVDVVILILLYTLAAYCRRRVSVAGLAVCLVGSAVAVARWAPSRAQPDALAHDRLDHVRRVRR